MLLGAAGGLVCGAIAAIGLSSALAEHVFGSRLASTLILLSAAWLIASTLQGLLAEAFRGFQNFGLATLFNGLLVNAFCMIVFGGAWLLDVHTQVAWVVTVVLAITSGSFIIAGLMMRHKVARMPPDGTAAPRELLTISWPFLVTSIASFALGPGIDLWVVGAFGTRSEVAVYGAATRLALLLAMPFLVATAVIPPIIAELDASGKRRQLERSVRGVSTVATLLAIPITAVFVFGGSEIMSIIYGPYFASGGAVLAILSLVRVFVVATGSSAPTLAMTGYQRALMIVTVLSAILSVTLEIALGWRYGMVGVAAGTSLALVVQNLVQLFMAHRRVGVWTHTYLTWAPLRAALHSNRGKVAGGSP